MGRSEARHGARVRALRLLQEQQLLRSHGSKDDRRHGQQRRSRRQYMDRVGVSRVEEFIDVCVSRQPHRSVGTVSMSLPTQAAAEEDEEANGELATLRSEKNHLDAYINPPDSSSRSESAPRTRRNDKNASRCTPSGTCSRSSSSTRRWSRGRWTSSRSCEMRRTTSCRCRRRFSTRVGHLLALQDHDLAGAQG